MAKFADGLKIISLEAENVKRLTAVSITPTGNVVEITGKNGQGKTSVLDSIWWALEGTSHIQAEPIRKGATEAFIKLDLGRLKVTRKFKAKEDGGYTTSITVENEDGFKTTAPQDMLNALMGQLSFDPLAFTRMKPKEQFETLKGFVKGVDFAALEEANKADFDKRTGVNRDLKAAIAQAAALKAPDDAPAERVDESKLVEELEKAGQHNANIERERSRRAGDEAAAAASLVSAENQRKRAAELRRQADELEAAAAQDESRAGAIRNALDTADPLPAPIDTAQVRASIDAARAANAKFDVAERARQESQRLADKVKQLESEAEALTKAIADREAEKQKAVAEAKMPVKDIGFGDGYVTFKGVPFDQASDAEQLRVSVAIAAAMKPTLRVIRVRDGSLLDDDSMGVLRKIAELTDMQVWIETVASGRPGAIVIEAGQVKAS